MHLVMIVDEVRRSLTQDPEVTLHAEGPGLRYRSYVVLRGSADPAVRDLRIGDRVVVTLEPIPAVSAVEELIESAEAHGLPGAMLV